MALPPLKLADIQVSAALTDNWGRPTSYSQRWWNDNNKRTTAAVTGVQQALADLATQQAQLTAQQATLTAQQATLTAQQAQLTAQQATLTTTVTSLTRLANAAKGVGADSQFSVTDGSGFVQFAHGYSDPSMTYPAAAKYSMAVPWGNALIYHIQWIDVDLTNMRFLCTDFSGAPLVSTGVAYTWHVAGA